MKTARMGIWARLLRPHAVSRRHNVPTAYLEFLNTIIRSSESPLLPTVRLSPVHPIVHASDKDYDHWIGYVCQHIDQAATFEVDVKAAPWGSEDTTTMSWPEGPVTDVLGVVDRLAERFLAEHCPLRRLSDVLVCPSCHERWQPQNATTCGPCGGYVPNGPVREEQPPDPTRTP